MIRFLGILFILAGACSICYGAIPALDGYSFSSVLAVVCGAVSIGGGIATLRFFKKNSK